MEPECVRYSARYSGQNAKWAPSATRRVNNSISGVFRSSLNPSRRTAAVRTKAALMGTLLLHTTEPGLSTGPCSVDQVLIGEDNVRPPSDLQQTLHKVGKESIIVPNDYYVFPSR